MISCTHCGRQNEDYYNFCLGCGNSLKSHWAKSEDRQCTQCGSTIPADHFFCGQCGTRVDLEAQESPSSQVSSPHDDETLKVEARPHTETVEKPVEEPVAVLQIINEDGSHGDRFELPVGQHLIGKDHGPDAFSEDPCLCPVHAQFSFTGQRFEVTDLDSVNGLYFRILDSVELSHGDQFRVGRQLLRLELYPDKDQDSDESVMSLGSPRGNAWGRLVRLTASGETSDAYVLSGLEQVMGREKGGVTFPGDGFVSGRHARVKKVGSRCYLEDLGSSNGTFIRIRGKKHLSDGDLILLGSQPLQVNL